MAREQQQGVMKSEVVAVAAESEGGEKGGGFSPPTPRPTTEDEYF